MVSESMHKSPAKLISLSLCFEGIMLVPVSAQSVVAADGRVRTRPQFSRQPLCPHRRHHRPQPIRPAICWDPKICSQFVSLPRTIFRTSRCRSTTMARSPCRWSGRCMPPVNCGTVAGQPGHRLQEVLQGPASVRAGERIPQPAGVRSGERHHSWRGATARQS